MAYETKKTRKNYAPMLSNASMLSNAPMLHRIGQPDRVFAEWEAGGKYQQMPAIDSHGVSVTHVEFTSREPSKASSVPELRHAVAACDVSTCLQWVCNFMINDENTLPLHMLPADVIAMVWTKCLNSPRTFPDRIHVAQHWTAEEQRHMDEYAKQQQGSTGSAAHTPDQQKYRAMFASMSASHHQTHFPSTTHLFYVMAAYVTYCRPNEDIYVESTLVPDHNTYFRRSRLVAGKCSFSHKSPTLFTACGVLRIEHGVVSMVSHCAHIVRKSMNILAQRRMKHRLPVQFTEIDHHEMTIPKNMLSPDKRYLSMLAAAHGTCVVVTCQVSINTNTGNSSIHIPYLKLCELIYPLRLKMRTSRHFYSDGRDIPIIQT